MGSIFDKVPKLSRWTALVPVLKRFRPRERDQRLQRDSDLQILPGVHEIHAHILHQDCDYDVDCDNHMNDRRETPWWSGLERGWALIGQSAIDL